MKALEGSNPGRIELQVVVAAGNTCSDACLTSPALVPEAITVGGSDLSGRNPSSSLPSNGSSPTGDTVYTDGNQGPCLDLFAPGVDIYSVCGGVRRCGNVTRDTYAFASGTSMAVPHVTGAAALYLARNPQATPAEVRTALINAASPDKIDPRLLSPGTPNLLLMTRLEDPSQALTALG